MHENSRIFLVGPMGAGKTTIGKRLANGLKLTFIDCDHEIERRTGVSIALIFDIEGEAGFRLREKRLIEELTQIDHVVLATGGGAVLDPENRQHLMHRGYTVYLHAPLEELLARTHNDTHRPLLKVANRADRLREIITFRAPLYTEVAALSIDTSKHSIGEVVSSIRRGVVA
ncbi:MAG: shikimate kinase [Gammaproteobacteria bacterium]|nr:shikimate kinase [Gammaproteobacteria bacterium]